MSLTEHKAGTKPAHNGHTGVLIRHTDRGDHLPMATVEQKICCEHRARELLAEQGLPVPALIEYGYTCIRLIWPESRLALRIDIDDEASTAHVVLIDRPHASQPPLASEDGDQADGALGLVGIQLSPN